jgi:hypothetical protein
MRLDYAGLAREFEATGFSNATIIGWDREILGNLRAHLPGAKMVQATSGEAFIRPEGRVVVIWDTHRWGNDGPPWSRTPRFLSNPPPSPARDQMKEFVLNPRPPCRRSVTILAYEQTP